MNYSSFIEHLEQCGNLSHELKLMLRDRCSIIIAEQRTHILKPENACKYVYFVSEGLFRNYTLKSGKDETTNFIGPNHFMTDISGFFNQSFSNEGIVCEQKAIIVRLSYHDWLAMCDQDPEFLAISMNVSAKCLISQYKQSHIYRTANTTQKVELLCKIYPGILNQVAQKHIASYFGVSEQAISVIISQLK